MRPRRRTGQHRRPTLLNTRQGVGNFAAQRREEWPALISMGQGKIPVERRHPAGIRGQGARLRVGEAARVDADSGKERKAIGT